MLKRWKTLSSKIARKNPWWTYKLDQFEIPEKYDQDQCDQGQYIGEYHYIETYGSCMVVPVSADGRVIMVNQFRYLGNRESLEFPSGGVEQGDSFLHTAHAELQQETAQQAGQMQFIGEFNPCKGLVRETCQVFLATQLQPVATEVAPDQTEEFEVIRCSPDELDEMIKNQEIWDGMTLAAWTLVRQQV